MVKMTLNFILISLAAVLAVWLADSGGMVSIKWLGYQSQISMSMFVAFVLVFSFLFMLVVNFLIGLCKFSNFIKSDCLKIGADKGEYKKIKDADEVIAHVVEFMELVSEDKIPAANKKLKKLKRILGDRPAIDLLAEKIDDLELKV